MAVISTPQEYYITSRVLARLNSINKKLSNTRNSFLHGADSMNPDSIQREGLVDYKQLRLRDKSDAVLAFEMRVLAAVHHIPEAQKHPHLIQSKRVLKDILPVWESTLPESEFVKLFTCPPEALYRTKVTIKIVKKDEATESMLFPEIDAVLQQAESSTSLQHRFFHLKQLTDHWSERYQTADLEVIAKRANDARLIRDVQRTRVLKHSLELLPFVNLHAVQQLLQAPPSQLFLTNSLDTVKTAEAFKEAGIELPQQARSPAILAAGTQAEVDQKIASAMQNYRKAESTRQEMMDRIASFPPVASKKPARQR